MWHPSAHLIPWLLFCALQACATERSLNIAASQNSGPSMPAVQIDKTVHFPAPDGSNRTVDAGVYEVMTWEENRLVLLPQTRPEPIVIQAQATEHTRPLTAPVALVISDESDRDVIHLVLLLSGHTGWDAAGSSSGIRSRATDLRKASMVQLSTASYQSISGLRRRIQPHPSPQNAPPPPPQWVLNSSVPYNGIPPTAFVGGSEAGRYLFVCRSVYNNGTHPGKVVDGRCNITWGGQELQMQMFEWLVGVPATAQWVHNTLDGSPPPHAFVGGQEPGRLLYVCRDAGVRIDIDVIPGWFPGKLVDGSCNYGYGGKEYQRAPQEGYEVLVIP
jgi:uncharacterized protein DUF3421